MKPSKFTRILCANIALFLSIIFFFTLPGLCKTYDLTDIKFSVKHAKACKKIIRTLEKHHYLEASLDNELSQKIIKRYIKRLDPSGVVFMKTDLDKFDQHKYKLDNDLKRGDLDFAEDIFNLYLARTKERLEYVLDLSEKWQKDLNFQTHEYFELEDDNIIPAVNKAELIDRWRKDLKNHILTLKIDAKTDEEITRELKKFMMPDLTG